VPQFSRKSSLRLLLPKNTKLLGGKDLIPFRIRLGECLQPINEVFRHESVTVWSLCRRILAVPLGEQVLRGAENARRTPGSRARQQEQATSPGRTTRRWKWPHDFPAEQQQSVI